MIEWFYLQIIAGKVNASPKIKGRNNPTIIIGRIRVFRASGTMISRHMIDYTFIFMRIFI